GDPGAVPAVVVDRFWVVDVGGRVVDGIVTAWAAVGAGRPTSRRTTPARKARTARATRASAGTKAAGLSPERRSWGLATASFWPDGHRSRQRRQGSGRRLHQSSAIGPHEEVYGGPERLGERVEDERHDDGDGHTADDQPAHRRVGERECETDCDEDRQRQLGHREVQDEGAEEEGVLGSSLEAATAPWADGCHREPAPEQAAMPAGRAPAGEAPGDQRQDRGPAAGAGEGPVT